MAAEKTESVVDEDLYSRQLEVLGHEAQVRIGRSSVLIVGLNGLGVETAKNVILAGVKNVSLYDATPASWTDMSSHFYITEEADLGKPRAEVCAHKLAELNPYVSVAVLGGELTSEKISAFNCVVLIDMPLEQQMTIAEYCHANKICVMTGDTFGVFGNIFCDFGEDFVVADTNGEQVAESQIAQISQDLPALVTTLEETRHGLQTGDKVLVTEVVGGMSAALNQHEFTVKVLDAYSFEIDVDTRTLGAYERGGYLKQVKQPVTLSFASMSSSLLCPYGAGGEIVTDFCKLDRAGALHLAFQSLHKFKKERDQFPEPGSVEHAQALFDMTVALNESISNEADASILKLSAKDLADNEQIIKRLAMCCRGQLSPVNALMGGVLGQEVLKACSGKFMPIKQWFYYDALETLPAEPIAAEEVQPLGCRYDGQIMVYGKSLQESISRLKLFVVGAGAIGCEMLKNLAMMGVATDEARTGCVHVTDMDSIEKSNLSRQFLFRNTDINHPKSTTATRAVSAMNPQFHSQTYESKVAPDTEALFNDDFFESLDMVLTALDNVEARLYVDERCVFYRKPMLDSGTLGSKGSTQVVIPGMTENYGATRDAPPKSIAICTVKHFPNLIEHTLVWGKEWFEETFKQTPNDANIYITSPDYGSVLVTLQNIKLDTLERVHEALVSNRPSSFEDCIVWARHQFESLFSNKIKQLMHKFPIDHATMTNTGVAQPFWTGAKKPPAPLEFDASDALHMEFIKSTANMRAITYDIQGVTWDDDGLFLSVLSSVVVEPFKPSDTEAIATTEEEAKSQPAAAGGGGGGGGGGGVPYANNDEQCNRILDQMPPPPTFGALRLVSVDFDKDRNDQMRVVAACGNLRARNYRIAEVEPHKARVIAGNITPAIATTTALVTGAICLEMIKVLQGKPKDQYFASFVNLAIPVFMHSEPNAPASVALTIRDRINIEDCPNMSIDQLLAFMLQKHRLDVWAVSTSLQGTTALFNALDKKLDKKQREARRHMPIFELYSVITGKTIDKSMRFLTLLINGDDAESGEEIDPLPDIRLRLPENAVAEE